MKPLSEKENEIFNLLKQGYCSLEIAEKLGVTIYTVKTLENRAYKKTGIKGRMELLVNTIKQMNDKSKKKK